MVHCSFVLGKSRLALIKPLSIPHLELQAAVLATRLFRVIDREFSQVCKMAGVVFWMDSQTVL